MGLSDCLFELTEEQEEYVDALEEFIESLK